MHLIYGNVPRTLPGGYRYAASAKVEETLAVGESSTPSYFEAAKFLADTNSVVVTVEAPTGNYEAHLEVSVDDGANFRVLKIMTQDTPSTVGVQYETADMKLRVTVIAAAGPVKVLLRQG